MNKKGQFEIIGLAIILVIALILGAIFYFSSTFRYVTIGAAFIVMGFVVLLNKSLLSRKSDRNVKVGIFIGLLAVGFILMFSSGVLNTIQQSGYIEAPFFGTVKCDRAVGGLITSQALNLRSDNDGFTKVTAPQNLESYDVLLTHEGESSIFESYRWSSSVCNSNGQSCTNLKSEKIPSFGINDKVIQSNVARDKFVFFTVERMVGLGSWEKVNEGFYRIKYQPYILFVQNSLEGGSNPVSGSKDCTYPSNNLKSNAIISSSVKDSSGKSLDETIPLYRNYLEPNENYNFLAGTVTRASFGNTVDYNGQTGYCAENIQGLGAVIYKIGEIKTLGKTYNVVDTSSKLKTLGTDGCCVENRVQGDRVCKNFQWEKLEEDDDGNLNVECSYSSPCNPGRFILGDGTKTHEYKCISGKCEITNIKNEECITNTDCKNDGEICVNYNCEKASSICGDGVCDALENKQNCEVDCGKEEDKCKWFENKVVETELDYGTAYWRAYTPFADPIETQVESCKVASWVSITLVALVITALGIFAIYITAKPKRKKK